MLGVHRRYSFLVLKVYLGSAPPDLERSGIVAKGFQMHKDLLKNQFAKAEKTSSYESLQFFYVKEGSLNLNRLGPVDLTVFNFDFVRVPLAVFQGHSCPTLGP